MNFNANYFELFGLPECFEINLHTLEQRYRELQIKIHPDRFVSASDQEKRLSLQWSTQINEAYEILKKPLSRAQYLLSLHGYDTNASDLVMSEDFLAEQIDWRERISEAFMASDLTQLEAFYEEIMREITTHYAQLKLLLDQSMQYVSAFEYIQQLMFLEKLRLDTIEAMAALEE